MLGGKGGGGKLFGSGVPAPSTSQTQQPVFASPTSPDAKRELSTSPRNSSTGFAGDDSAAIAEMEKLVGLLRMERDQLSDELVVKNQLAISLANGLVVAQADAQQARRDMAARIDLINQMQLELHDLAFERDTLHQTVNNLEKAAKSAAEDAASVAVAAASNTELAKLREEKASLEAQMSDWKAKVKEALRENKKREQQLTSAEIELRTELKTVQERLSESQFQVTSLQAKQNRVRVAKEVQTDQLLSAPSLTISSPNAVGGGGGEFGSPIGSTGGAARRRGYSKEVRSPSLQPATASTGPVPFFGSSASVGVKSPPTAPPPLPLQTSSLGRSDNGALSSFASLYESFPLPISLTEAAVLALDPRAATLSPDGRGPSPAAPPDTPEAPFIVAVHYAAEQEGGWSVETKHRVTVGMTTAELIAQCCEQCASRYNVVLVPDRVCIRMNHDKAKRKVTLSLPRKLHSFMYFKKCQKDGTPIVLYLCQKDELAEAVNETMNVAGASHSITT